MVHRPSGSPRLPTDVLEAIIDQADDTTSLCCLSLTSSILLHRARYRLFTVLTIQTLKKLESSFGLFESHPWLRPLVKKVTLSVVLPLDYPHGNIPLLSVVPVHLLSQLPNLRVWCMGAEKLAVRKPVYLSLHRCTVSRYKRFGGHIQDLRLFSFHFNAVSDFTGLVSSFTGIQNLTCARIRFRETVENVQASQSPLKGSRMGLLSRQLKLKIRNIHLGEFVDVRAVEYLLNSIPSGLDTLTLTMNALVDEQESYIERLKPWLSGLSHLSTLTYAILCGHGEYRDSAQITLQNGSNGEQILIQGLRRIAAILDHVSRRHVRKAQVLFEMDQIDALARSIFSNDVPLETFKGLEQVLLTFSRCCVLFRTTRTEHRGRRAEFWQRVIRRAFPQVNERGLLIFCPAVKPDVVVDPLAHESLVNCLVASHDSQRIVSASSDGTIIAWDSERGTIVHERLAHRDPILALALSPDSRRLVSAGGSGLGALIVWDIDDTVSKVASLEGRTETLNACVWSPDGALIASSDRGAVRVWDARTFKQRDLVLRLNEREPVFVPDLCSSLRTAAISLGYASRSWPRRFEARPPRISHRENGYIHALSFHPGSGRVATAYGFAHWRAEENVVRVWDVASGAVLIALAGHKTAVADVSFSPDGRSVLSASADGVAKVWDAESGEETASFSSVSGGQGKITKACFSPDGKLVAIRSFHGDSTVQLWRIEDGASIMAFRPEHVYSVELEHIVFSPNGEFLASGDSQGKVHIHRVPSLAQH